MPVDSIRPGDSIPIDFPSLDETGRPNGTSISS